MNDQEAVLAPVCKERMKRLEERIDKAEIVTNEIHNLTLSVERLTITVQNMVTELATHEKRLDTIEQKDGEMWRALVKYVVTGIAGVILGYALKQLGF